MCGDKMLDSFITKYKNKFPTSSIIILEEVGINNLYVIVETSSRISTQLNGILMFTDRNYDNLGGSPNNSNYRFAALCRWGIKARKFQPTIKL